MLTRQLVIGRVVHRSARRQFQCGASTMRTENTKTWSLAQAESKLGQPVTFCVTSRQIALLYARRCLAGLSGSPLFRPSCGHRHFPARIPHACQRRPLADAVAVQLQRTNNSSTH